MSVSSSHALQSHSLGQRRAAVLALMQNAGIDQLVCAGNGHHMIDLPNAIAHLTGYRSVGPAVLVIGADGATRLVTSPENEADRIEPLALADRAIAVDDLGSALAALGLRAGSVATVGLDAMPRKLAELIIDRIGTGHRSIDAAFDAATGRKTDHEIACAREATRIAEAGYRHMLEIVRPGMTECDLAIAVNLHMRALGANDSFLMLNCGPRADAVMPSSERPIEAGDLLLCELSPSVDGQFVQICRTVSIGAPRPEVTEKYRLLIDAMRDGIETVRPGVAMGAVCMAIDDNLSAVGYAKFSRPPFIRRRGHGLGSGSVCPGDVSVDNDIILQPGMLFMVHPNQFLPETGYMMCGEPVLVTDAGFEVLTERQAELAIVDCGRARS